MVERIFGARWVQRRRQRWLLAASRMPLALRGTAAPGALTLRTMTGVQVDAPVAAIRQATDGAVVANAAPRRRAGRATFLALGLDHANAVEVYQFGTRG